MLKQLNVLDREKKSVHSRNLQAVKPWFSFIDKKAALDFPPRSIWTRSTSLASSAQTVLLHTARLRTPLYSWRDAADLQAFRLKDVLQPPGACTDVQNKTDTSSSRAIAIFSQLSASPISLSVTARHSLVFSPPPSIANACRILRARKQRISRLSFCRERFQKA